MPEPIRLAVVGCGGIAQAYLQALARVPQLRLAAVVDSDAGRRAAAATAFQAEPFASIDELLGQRSRLPLQAALVLTPPNTHEALAEHLLQAGLHVLCEKPLAISSASAQRMLQAAQRSKHLLMMGSKFRYTPDMPKAKELLDQGTIGQVLLYENVFCSRVDMTKRWNGVRSIAGGGVMIDNGCHSIDIARFLIGPIARVQAQFGRQVQPLEVEDTARVQFEFTTGAMGQVDLSWSLHKEVPFYVRVYGSKGALEVGFKGSRYKPEGQKEWTPFGSGYDKFGAFAAQLQNFAGVIADTERPVITNEDALASVQVIETAYRSAHEHKWHELA